MNILRNYLGPLRFTQKREEEDDHTELPAKPTTEADLVCAGWTNSRECEWPERKPRCGNSQIFFVARMPYAGLSWLDDYQSPPADPPGRSKIQEGWNHAFKDHSPCTCAAYLFGDVSLYDYNRGVKFMAVIDAIYSRDSLYFAFQGSSRPWKMRQSKLSGRFTTQLSEVLTI